MMGARLPMEQRRSRVSAIVPVYNGAAFISAAIESILAQTRPVDEVVVIDDGSTDETPAIVRRYASAGVRCISQQNRGLSEARNRGILETTGELVTFLDCDDTWLPEKTALQIEYLATHPDVALVAAQVWWWDTQSNRRWIETFGVPRPASIERELTVRNCIGNASAVMVRRSALDQLGLFDPAQIWAEDWEMWMRIVSRFKIGFVERPLITYRSHSGGLSFQRRWDRAYGNFELARDAISKFRPAWWRPILLLRAWSRLELSRAHASRDMGFPRYQYLWHAARALVSCPFDEAKVKLGHFNRALLGESWYKIFQLVRAPPRNLSRPQLQASSVRRQQERGHPRGSNMQGKPSKLVD